MSATNPHIRLRPATLRGQERKRALRETALRVRLESGRHLNAWVHSTPSTAKVYRVAEDAIIISDGGSGYLPFSISRLEEILREARELPIITGELILP